MAFPKLTPTPATTSLQSYTIKAKFQSFEKKIQELEEKVENLDKMILYLLSLQNTNINMEKLYDSSKNSSNSE